MKQSENGNGILEILLFLPIAILLLSAGVDCALWLRERGALRDALRAGIHSQALTIRDARLPTAALGLGALLRTGEDSTLEVPRQNRLLRKVVRETADLIAQSLQMSSGLTDSLKVEGQLVLLRIEPENGVWTGWTFEGETVSYPPGAESLLDTAVPGFESLSAEEYLRSLFSQEGTSSPSLFATPRSRLLPPHGESSGSLSGGETYFPETPALVLKVSALTKGLPYRPLAQLFPNLAAIEEITFVPLRTTLG